MWQLLRTLFEIQSPGAQLLGIAPPTPAWVRIFWAAFDVIAWIVRAVLIFAAALAVGLVIVGILMAT